MRPALLFLSALLLLAGLTGCATLSPGQRVALYCNPLAHAVDLAMVGVLAAGIVTHKPDVAIGGGILLLSPGPLPGVSCYSAIADAANGEKP